MQVNAAGGGGEAAGDVDDPGPDGGPAGVGLPGGHGRGAGKVERQDGAGGPCGVGRVAAGGQVGQGPVLQLGDDLLDDGVVAVPLVGLDRGQGAVGDEGVVAVGREQLALLGPVR